MKRVTENSWVVTALDGTSVFVPDKAARMRLGFPLAKGTTLRGFPSPLRNDSYWRRTMPATRVTLNPAPPRDGDFDEDHTLVDAPTFLDFEP